MPKGLDKARQDIVLDVMAWILRPDQQADNFDSGFFYPGPAVKNVPISMAPASSQQVMQQYGRPEYDTLIQQSKIELPLDTANIVTAFSTWDKEIGSGKYKSS
jgi:putative spermidine/putrescine transport system substrate-binding protein